MIRLLTVTILLSGSAWCCSPNSGPPVRRESNAAFRSELWQMEYRSGEDEDQESETQQVSQTEIDEVINPDAESASTAPRSRSQSPLPPGSAENVSLAVAQVDEAAGYVPHRSVSTAPARHRNDNNGFLPDPEEAPAGPTATTIAAALAACVALAGVLFCGQD